MAANEEALMDMLGAVKEINWNAENDVHLFYAMLGHKPVGVTKHFQMIPIIEKFRNSSNIDCTSALLWARLRTYYDIDNLDKLEVIPFPNDECEFSLPEEEYGDIIEERKKKHEREPKDTEEVIDIKPEHTSITNETVEEKVAEQDEESVEKTSLVKKESVKGSTESVKSDIKTKDCKKANSQLAKKVVKFEGKAKPSPKVVDKNSEEKEEEKEIKTASPVKRDSVMGSSETAKSDSKIKDRKEVVSQPVKKARSEGKVKTSQKVNTSNKREEKKAKRKL